MKNYMPFLAISFFAITLPAFSMDPETERAQILAEWNQAKHESLMTATAPLRLEIAKERARILAEQEEKSLAATIKARLEQVCLNKIKEQEDPDGQLIDRANNLVDSSCISSTTLVNSLLRLKKRAHFLDTAHEFDKAMEDALPELPTAAETPAVRSYSATISPSRNFSSPSPFRPSPSPATISSMTGASPVRFSNSAAGEPTEFSGRLSAIFGTELEWLWDSRLHTRWFF